MLKSRLSNLQFSFAATFHQSSPSNHISDRTSERKICVEAHCSHIREGTIAFNCIDLQYVEHFPEIFFFVGRLGYIKAYIHHSIKIRWQKASKNKRHWVLSRCITIIYGSWALFIAQLECVCLYSNCSNNDFLTGCRRSESLFVWFLGNMIMSI